VAARRVSCFQPAMSSCRSKTPSTASLDSRSSIMFTLSVASDAEAHARAAAGTAPLGFDEGQPKILLKRPKQGVEDAAGMPRRAEEAGVVRLRAGRGHSAKAQR